ncbi:MAG: hypothetical protein ABSA71_14760 [Desulfomonilia bacterium]|jgi:hypothetical protein
MAGPTDISTILSQTGRIEKINQNPFVQSEVARQILTEEEAKARLRKNKEVAESKKAQEISVRDKTKGDRGRENPKEKTAEAQTTSEEDENSKDEKHIIDVVV